VKAYDADDIELDLIAAVEANDADEILRLGELLDTYDQRHQPIPLVSAALWYAEQGLHVFPLQPGSKIPHKGSQGLKDATTDPGRIRGWWQAEPRSNVAIATGHLVDVIDVDGAIGMVSWCQQIADEPEEMPTVLGRVSTPRAGGNHFYVKADEEYGNGASVFPGVDYRGKGGYVVAPPSVNSVHPVGVYTWIKPLDLTGIRGD
jgi:hypothetical protein